MRTLKHGYRTWMADPPWTGENGGNRAAPGHNVGAEGRRGELAYKPMRLQDIMDLPVGAQSAPDAILGLWAPWIMAVCPETKNGQILLPPALQVALAWGFAPFGAVPWIKGRWAHPGAEDGTPEGDALVLSRGMGNYVRVSCEVLILCKRGTPRVDPADRPPGILPLVPAGTDLSEQIALLSQRRGHSEKPDCARALLEALYPGPRAELFARESAEGWDAWGNQAPVTAPRLAAALGAPWLAEAE